MDYSKAKEFCEELDEKYGEAWSNDYEDLPKFMQEFANKLLLGVLEEEVTKSIEVTLTDLTQPKEAKRFAKSYFETKVKPKYEQ